jgi:hypothetical protein
VRIVLNVEIAVRRWNADECWLQVVESWVLLFLWVLRAEAGVELVVWSVLVEMVLAIGVVIKVIELTLVLLTVKLILIALVVKHLLLLLFLSLLVLEILLLFTELLIAILRDDGARDGSDHTAQNDQLETHPNALQI